jgi:DNA-binding transcriptional ArsR family regulator
MLYNAAMDTFAALADPTRRKIVELLANEGPVSATEIAQRFPISAPAISQHLKVLREAHVILMDKRAQQRIYRLNPDAFSELEGWAKRMTELWTRRYDAFEQVLEAAKKNAETRTSEREAQ